MTVTFQPRQCGMCTECCRLLPVHEKSDKGLHSLAGEPCKYQSSQCGCMVYAARPIPCKLWSCAWLRDPSTAAIKRPDVAHYVIDIMAEYVINRPHDGGPDEEIPVIQIWCDPKYPDAHRDPELRAWLKARTKMAIIRYNSQDSIVIFHVDGEWREKATDLMRDTAHDPADIMRVTGGFIVGAAP
jgi:hypothetical protein